MNMLFRQCGLLIAMLLATNAYAGDIQIETAWLRATAPGQDAASVDLSITSKQPAVLLEVSSEICRVAELHRMFQEDGMMKMREVKALELPAGRKVNLGQSGYHLMLVGLKAPLKAGEKVPLTLTFKLAENRIVKVNTVAVVRPLTATKAPSDQGEHEHMRME